MTETFEFWASYLTNGRHLNWYASLQYTIVAALLGGAFALLFGIGGAAMRNSATPPLRFIGSIYINMVRGVPDVLFFLFFPLAFEQLVELFLAQGVCAPGEWPPGGLAALPRRQLVPGHRRVPAARLGVAGHRLRRLHRQRDLGRAARRAARPARGGPRLRHEPLAGAVARAHPADVDLCPARPLELSGCC